MARSSYESPELEGVSNSPAQEQFFELRITDGCSESPTREGTSAPKYWSKLPVEYRQRILDLVIAGYRYQHSNPFIRAGYATVCREWQIYFEHENFRRLIVDQDRVRDLEEITSKYRRRESLVYLFLRIRLNEYACTECQSEESTETSQKNNSVFSTAIWTLLVILSKWKVFLPTIGRFGRKKRGIVLELGAYSPSDCQHTFRDFRLEPDYPYQRPRDFFYGGQSYQRRKLLQLNDSSHGWRDGQRNVRELGLGAKQRTLGSLLLINLKETEFAAFDGVLPEAGIVSRLQIRRQFYRQISTYSLNDLVHQSFTGLGSICHEMWRSLDTQRHRQWHQGLGYCNFFIKGLPSTLRNLSIFEDFNKVMHPERVAYAQLENISMAVNLAKASRSLTKLSAAFIVDAEDFFHEFSLDYLLAQPNIARWETLRCLSLTHRDLRQEWIELDRHAFYELIATAGRAAALMPHLELLEIWNASFTFDREQPYTKFEGSAAVFQYRYSAPQPHIKFRSNWWPSDHFWSNELRDHIYQCWAKLPRHGPTNPLKVDIEFPGFGRVQHPADAIYHLDLKGYIMTPFSYREMCHEYLQFHPAFNFQSQP